MRTEYAAFHFLDNIVWLAYYYTGGGKEDTAYTAGWQSDLEGAARYAQLKQVLESQFGFDKHRPFLVDANHTSQIVGIGSPFIGCTQVFFDSTMDVAVKAVMMSWFLEAGIACLEVTAPWQPVEEINTRWQEAMGEPCSNDTPVDIGQNRALTIMQAGLEALSGSQEPPHAVAATAKPQT